MATKPQSIDFEIAHFDSFKDYLPEYKKMCAKTLKLLLKRGMLQVSTCFEHALAHTNGTVVVNEDHCDLSDGSDAKLCTTQFHRGKCDVQVSNVTGKRGMLRVQVYEQFTDKIYFFAIPYGAYGHLKVLEIGFMVDGRPNRNTKWWRYEVNTFVALANA